MNLSAALKPVCNRGSAPHPFLATLVETVKTLPDEIFAVRKDDPDETDIYTSVKAQLGPWESLLHRRAAMCEVLRVLAGFESSWVWALGFDTNNPDENRPATKSAGAFQVSANSMYFGMDLRTLMGKHGVGERDGDAFQAAIKADPALQIEYTARLLRHLVRSNGPVVRHEIHAYLNRDAVKEFQTALGGTPQQASPGVLEPLAAPSGTLAVDARSEKAIATLHPRVQPLAREVIVRAAAAGIKAVITSGSRTYAEQDALYEQGRTKPGKVVTNARGGASNHNHGIAFDVTVFDGATPKWEGPEYRKLGDIGESLGLEWGGRWVSIQDEPHFELHPAWAKGMNESAMLSALRAKHDAGQDAFA